MSADITTLQKSMLEPENITPFTEKQVLFINDTNGGSYNGSITFDTTVLSNSGRYLDYSDASIQVPLVVSMVGSVDLTGANVVHAFTTGLKSGHYNLIDSIQVDYQNKNVVQQQSFTNFYVNYKILSEWSSDDLEKYGAATGVSPDSPASFTFQNAASSRGLGITNNVPFFTPAVKLYTQAAPIQSTNDGFARRLENSAVASVAGVAGYGALPTMVTSASFNNVGQSYLTNPAAGGAAAVYFFSIAATIRLKDICDFFDKIPILKGAQIRMNINYNACSFRLTNVAVGPTTTLTTYTQIAGRTCPVLVPGCQAGAPYNAVVAAGNGTFDVEYNVLRTTNVGAGTAVNAFLRSCQLFVPAYTMAADIEAKYLTSSPIKTIVYNDIYQYTVSSVAALGSFNAILTNGILNPQKLIIIPFVNPAGTGTASDEFKSPFDTAPSTTGPLVSISNFQVQVSGKNMFDHPVNYDFEMFRNEVSKTGINGGVTTGLSSGLITKRMFQFGYRYYVCDLARRLESANSIPLSVQISGTNGSNTIVDYYCVILYERNISIESSSGVVVQA